MGSLMNVMKTVPSVLLPYLRESFIVFTRTDLHLANKIRASGWNFPKAKVQIERSQWSDDFTLDAVGIATRIKCKSTDWQYEISVDVHLSRSGLTKVVCFSPFFLINNLSPLAILVREVEHDDWFRVEARSCVGFWPHQTNGRKFLTVRYEDTKDESVIFPSTESFEGFCCINNEHLGVYVTCSFETSCWVVRLEAFEPGMAPALIMNCTKEVVEFAQKGSKAMKRLESWEQCMFTWADMRQNRELEWKSGDEAHTDRLLSNDFGSYKFSHASGRQHYWVSFLDGRQRVLLFTDDVVVATLAVQAYEVESISHEINISLRGLGISLVNNANAEELLYICINSSPVVWEQFDKSTYKLLTVKQMEAMEKAYSDWLRNPTDDVVIVDGMHVDFNRMKLRNKKSEKSIRRYHQSGLWMQYRQSPHQTHVHLKLGQLQVDNQLVGCVFPTAVSTVSTPKSVANSNAPKPFAECSVAICYSEHSSLFQVKYLHLLVQEFAVRFDEGLINALIAFFVTDMALEPYDKNAFNKDFAMTQNQLSELAVNTSTPQRPAFYNDLHISPLMVHVSFSKGGSSQKANKKAKGISIHSEFVDAVLKSIGVTLTDFNDVLFRLGFFERKCVFYKREQLQSEILSHYMKQAIKQLHVLIFGLELLGNPYGLLRDLSSGVQDFFYQPYQGAIEGPEEFANGVRQGVKSLFGATVGGASGAASRITGTLGKGLATLTCDEDFIGRRQRMMNERPRNVGEGFARGAEGIGWGFYEGVTGIVSKPLEGARMGGVEGFAKGVAKGVVGVAVRPVSGVVDFASCSLSTVRTATFGLKEAGPSRLPRAILPDTIIRPYSAEMALGAKIFRDVQRGSLMATERFIAHKHLSATSVIIITDKAVLLLKKNALDAPWKVQWHLIFSELKRPEICSRTIHLRMRKERRGFLNLRPSREKVVMFESEHVAKEVAEKITNVYDAQME